MGKAYIIDFCRHYCNEKAKDEIYQIYITDALKALTHNTARIYGGTEMQSRYIDLVEPQNDEDDGTAEEKAEEIKTRIKMKLEGISKDGSVDIKGQADAG